ncbi:ANR family transcriptional regulator [Serratia sp. OS31]|uniref:ANR family transcriptional regulator n=1 Tax=Serratia sp. OS31 TaxID=2760844 RepID=UPI0016000A25|nr:ANR family transcriptional regulator [Serratia sp. OS31]MBB1584759.1 ANR family transcriptional regulator [Serratia sp. OS31]
MDKKNSYQSTASMAAKLEQGGNFEQAAYFWRIALHLAKNGTNEDWCWVRATLCERREQVLRSLTATC